MEQILQKLLVANSTTIQEGTKELKEAFKNTEAIPALCDVLVASASPQVRQTAAVVLRRRLGKRHCWNKLDVNVRNRIKQGMLQALLSEQEKLVKNSIAQFIGIVGKYEFPDNTWPEILQFIHQLCSSENVLDREMGMYTLSIMTEISKGSYLPHTEVLATLFTNILNNMQELSSNLAYYTVITMKHLVSVIGGHHQMVNVYHTLLPRVLEIINSFCQTDEKRACELFEILEDLMEDAVAVVISHIRVIMEMCLRIGCNKDIETSVQIKAISVIGWIIRVKSKVVQKNKLIEPVIDVLIQLMAQKPEDDVNEEYFLGDPDQFTTTTIAAQTLDLVALNVPPEKVVPYLLMRVEPALQGNDIYAQKAAYLALAVLAEGCADYIRKKYLEAFLKCIYNGIKNPNVVVRNAAFFALGQFSEHLQPEISQYASELLPVFFDYLSQLFVEMSQSKTEPSGLDRMFYALQAFCLNLDDGLLPYLPTLMERLLVALDPSSWSLQLKRVALSTLESVASAVKEKIMPYFQKIIEILFTYINANPDSDIHELQSYALECLATVADTVDPETFKPLSQQTLEMALKILAESEDPDVKKSIYALCAALAGVMKEGINPALPTIVDAMIKTIQSSEGIIAHYEEDEKEGLDLYDDISGSENEDEEDIENESVSSDSTQCRYSVENSYNDEKEQACLSLTELSKKLSSFFLPYLEKSFEEIFKLLDYPQEDIRSSAIAALEQFCITLHEQQTPEGKQALYKALQMFIPKCAQIIKFEEEQNIVIQATNAYSNMLESIKGDMFVGEGHREAIMNCVIDLLTKKTTCQDNDNNDSGDTVDDDEESEQTELLLECAGDIIPKYGNALTPDEFVLYFQNVLNLLSIRTKNKKSVSQRSFGYGTLAECMKPLGIYVEKFVPALLQLWVAGAKDESEDVRNNSVFGLGEMVLYGKDCMFPHYNDILHGLSNMLPKETHSGTMDNISGALAKLIIANVNAVPMDQVFPALLQHLPLKTDFAENEAIIKCFCGLYQQGNVHIKNNMENVVKIVVHIYHNKQTENDVTLLMVTEFLKTINRDFPQEFGSIVSSLGEDVTGNVQKLFIS
ncbi:importin-4-like [Onthophagus taurus]|uniref:importin-4-like n=1 Tax=Onthophagus taurus TaxID=166361 RepID=UPI000C207F3C|nr:importin-4-like [Onthophagus taurus]